MADGTSTDFLKTQIERALAQGDKLTDLLQRAGAERRRRRVREADRVPHVLRADYTFQQSDNLQQPLVFNVPRGHSFEAHRFMLFAEMRIVSVQTADGASELTFRPTVWTNAVMLNLKNTPNAWPNPIDRLVDGTVEIAAVDADGVTTHEYQNAPFPVAQCFSSAMSSDLAGFTLNSAKPSALVFAAPWLLSPGTALSARVTPTFSGVRTADTRINEYRIVGLLEGFKRLGAQR